MRVIPDEQGEERIDKWLNYVCLFKTRAKASKACDGRRIKINGTVAKPSKIVRKGDRVTVKTKGGKYNNFIVQAVCHQNIPSKEAGNYYVQEKVELSDEAKELMELHKDSLKIPRRKFKGRPTKKERREMEKIKRQLGNKQDH